MLRSEINSALIFFFFFFHKKNPIENHTQVLIEIFAFLSLLPTYDDDDDVVNNGVSCARPACHLPLIPRTTNGEWARVSGRAQ